LWKPWKNHENHGKNDGNHVLNNGSHVQDWKKMKKGEHSKIFTPLEYNQVLFFFERKRKEMKKRRK